MPRLEQSALADGTAEQMEQPAALKPSSSKGAVSGGPSEQPSGNGDDQNRPQDSFAFDEDQIKEFAPEKLQEISEGTDAFIDDPELLTSKKSLQDKYTPASLVNTLKSKYKDSGITDYSSRRRNPITLNSDLFMFTVSMQKIEVKGQAEEASKKTAQQRACQVFLKNLFPPGTSWNDVMNIVQNDRDMMLMILNGEKPSASIVDPEQAAEQPPLNTSAMKDEQPDDSSDVKIM